MQFGRFITGGYYLHKIEGDWKGYASAWFDLDGNLIDAQQITRTFGPARPVKHNGPMWQEIQRIGKRYQHIPAP